LFGKDYVYGDSRGYERVKRNYIDDTQPQRFELELAAVGYLDLLNRLVLSAHLAVLNSLNDVHSLKNLAEHNVLPIEPSSRHGGNEELGAIRVRPSVCHREETGSSVLELEVFRQRT